MTSVTPVALQFLTFPWWGVLLGLAGIAALLFVLHRLRIRFREEVVPTTMFWKRALDERQARVLMQRFRHPWTYVLATCIASLLWLAASRPASDNTITHADAVVLWDTSANAEPVSSTRRAVLTVVDRLAGRKPSVLVCDHDPRSILTPAESSALLPERAKRVEQRMCHSSVSRILDDLDSARESSAKLDVYVVGSMESLLASRWEGLQVHHVGPVTSVAKGTKDEIQTLGITAAASGAWDRVDIFVGTSGDGMPTLSEGATSLSLQPIDDGKWVSRDVAARGQMVSAKLGKSQAMRVLPNRRVVAIADNGGDARHSGFELLRRIVTLDSGLSFGEGESARVSLGADETGVPTLSVDAGEHASGIVLVVPPSYEARARAFASSWSFPMIDRVIGRDEPLGELRVDVTVDDSVTAPRLLIGGDLLGSRSNFTASAQFPAFVSSGIRFLAGEGEALQVDVAVGDAISLPVGPVTTPVNTKTQNVDGVFTPTVAGAYRLGDGSSMAATLMPCSHNGLSNSVTRVTPESVAASSRPFTWAWVLGLLALITLLVEWVLVRRERIP